MAHDTKEMFKFLGLHLVCGLVAALIFGTALLVSDLSHIRTMAFESSNPILIVVLLYFGLMVTFGSLAMGVGIMGMGGFAESNRDKNKEDE
jgi:hypothetical protein